MGKEGEVIGLSLIGLENIKGNVYQIGMQSTSSKEYFKISFSNEQTKSKYPHGAVQLPS
jgi:hypothetical protein